MVTASFTGLLKTILFILLAYYAIKFLFRLFAPMIIQQVVRKAEQNFYDKQHQYSNNQQQTNNTKKHEPPKEKKKVGEYIDYEELD